MVPKCPAKEEDEEEEEEDLSAAIDNACAALETGELIHSDAFNLQEVH